MAESCLIEIYENQTFIDSDWISYSENPWTMKSTTKGNKNNFGSTCRSPDEITLPSSEWVWTSNWRIDRIPGKTDTEGWEYASRISRFKSTSRKAKKEKGMFDRARRRLWSRVMRREMGISKSADLTKIIPKIQFGLNSIYASRVRIEDILNQAPEASDNQQFQSLVESVQKNIADLMNLLEQAEKQPQGCQINLNPNNIAIIKKLRNDVLREETAIEKALYPINNSKHSKGWKLYTPSHDISIGSQPNGSNPNDRNMSFSNGSISGSFSSNMSSRPTFAGSHNSSNIEINASRYTDFDKKSLAKEAAQPKEKAKKSTVMGGSAIAFNPSMMNKRDSKRQHNPFEDVWRTESTDDGVFVERSAQQLLIEQKFIPIDEVTVMQEIIDERAIEIEKINKGVIELNAMFVDLSEIVKQQQIGIDEIWKNTDTSHEKAKEALAQIVEANSLQKSGNCIIS